MKRKGKVLNSFIAIIYYNIQNIRIPNWRAYISIATLPLLRYLFSPSSFYSNLLRIIVLLVTVSVFLAFAFGINNYYDTEEDLAENDPKKNPIAFDNLSRNIALGFLMLLILTGISLVVIISSNNMHIIIEYALLLFLAWGYSARPIRFKSRPFLDVFSHGLFFGNLIYIYSYHFLFPYIDPLSVLKDPLIYMIFLYSISLELRNEIEDFDFDKSAGVKTTAVLIGKEGAKYLVLAVLFIHWSIPTIFSFLMKKNPLTLLFSPTMFFMVAISYFLLNNKFKWYRLNDIVAIVCYIYFASFYRPLNIIS